MKDDHKPYSTGAGPYSGPIETRNENPAVTVITSELRIIHMPASAYMRQMNSLPEHVVLPGTVKSVKVQAASYELVEVTK